MVVDSMTNLEHVEVVATVADDGTIRTRSLLMPDSYSVATSSLVDRPDGPLSHKQEAPLQPGLVPASSMSDSEESSLCGSNDEKPGNNALVLSKCSTCPTEAALAGNEITKPEEGAVEMYDCLSDQLTNFFCPVEQPANFCVEKSAPSTPPRASSENQLTVNCADAGCSEYQFRDFFGSQDGVDVLSSLQFWMNPGKKEGLKGGTRQKPQNRSSCTRRRRSQRVQKVWNSWHAVASIPLARARSYPSEPRSPAMSMSEDDDVCYDSDPGQEYPQRIQRGEVLENPPPKPHEGFRTRRPPPINTTPEFENCYLGVAKVPSAPRNDSTTPNKFNFYPRRRDTFVGTHQKNRRRFFDAPIAPTEFDLMSPEGEHVLRTFIQEATNTKIPLVWHRRTKGEDTIQRKAPISVNCAFEVGAHLDNLVVQPKFTWSPTYEPHLPQRRIQLSGAEPDSIELLSIIRVVKPTHLNRNLYPYARLDRTCCITTNDEEFPYLVFEAPSTRERDWLVNAMKMIVARLASIIIVRDEAMLLEFFTPYAALMHLEPPPKSSSKTQSTQKDDDETAAPALDPNGELQLVSYGGGK